METVLIIEGSLGSCLLERKDSVLRHKLNKSLFSKMKQILQKEIGVVCLQVKHHNEFHAENFKESLILTCVKQVINLWVRVALPLPPYHIGTFQGDLSKD